MSLTKSKLFRLRTRYSTGAAAFIVACYCIEMAACADGVPAEALSPNVISVAPISPNDVSWLFPPPVRASDFANLIAIQDLTIPDSKDPTKQVPVWTDSVFKQVLAIAAGPAAQVSGTPFRIALPASVQSMDKWFIAGIRIDAGAPGLTSDVRAQFGQLPQIRIIVQPVIKNPDGTPQVQDIAVHLVFDILSGVDPAARPGCGPRGSPNLPELTDIVHELVVLRTKLANGQLGAHKIVTSNSPLGVHPGLVDQSTSTNVRQEMKAFLARHVSHDRLDAMAIMSATPAPWIFLAMAKENSNPDAFVPIHSPTLDGMQIAQMLDRAQSSPRVMPAPHTNNLAPVTCLSAALQNPAPPILDRKGFSTADVFSAQGKPPANTKDILDLIADPGRSHFFNTDCVSCHTETQLTMNVFKLNSFPGIDPAVVSSDPWNVRNFGWFPQFKGPARASVTRRTANETQAVVNYINTKMLDKTQ